MDHRFPRVVSLHRLSLSYVALPIFLATLFLIFSQAQSAQAYEINERVVTIGSTEVRSTPSTSGTLLWTQPIGVPGKVLGEANAEGQIWTQVYYDDGAKGWSRRDTLQTTNIQPKFQIDTRVVVGVGASDNPPNQTLLGENVPFYSIPSLSGTLHYEFWGSYYVIQNGPVKADGITWWHLKFIVNGEQPMGGIFGEEGWVPEEYLVKVNTPLGWIAPECAPVVNAFKACYFPGVKHNLITGQFATNQYKYDTILPGVYPPPTAIPAIVRVEPAVNLHWKASEVDPLIADDFGDYRGLWQGIFDFEAGQYRFTASHGPNAMRIYVDGVLIHDAWYLSWNTSVTHYMSAGQHTVTVQYGHMFGDGNAHVEWQKVMTPPPLVSISLPFSIGNIVSGNSAVVSVHTRDDQVNDAYPPNAPLEIRSPTLYVDGGLTGTGIFSLRDDRDYGPGQCSDSNYSSCAWDHGGEFICGVAASYWRANHPLVCNWSAEAKAKGFALVGEKWTVDDRLDFSGPVMCNNNGGDPYGPPYGMMVDISKTGEDAGGPSPQGTADRALCQAVQLPPNATWGYAELLKPATSFDTGPAAYCPAGSFAVGGRDLEGKNDAWDAIFCAPIIQKFSTVSPIPPDLAPKNFAIGDRVGNTGSVDSSGQHYSYNSVVGADPYSPATKKTMPYQLTGTVVGGPAKADKYTWWQVAWDQVSYNSSGVQTVNLPVDTGSTAEEHLEKIDFSLGGRVKTTSPSAVRQTPLISGALLSTQVTGTAGIVVAGPAFTPGLEPYQEFWKVKFDNGAFGWVHRSTLEAEPPDFTKPVISAVVSSNITQTSAVIFWITDELSDTQVQYGPTASYGSSSGITPTLVTAHSVNLFNLQPGTTYHYRVTSKDRSGNLAISPDFIFTTVTLPPSAVPTFGYSTVGMRTDTGDSNVVLATSYQSGPPAGETAAMSVYITSPVSPAPNNQFQVAIYSDVNGAPGTLVASSASQTITPDSWNTVPITAILAPNTFYWLVYNTNGTSSSQNNVRFDTGTTGQSRYRSQTFGTWPATYSSIATNYAARASMYVTYGTGTPAVPTFGYPKVGATAGASSGSNLALATSYQSGSQAGEVASMSIYFTSPVGSAPNNQFQVAIYSDVNGAPGILIASSASQTIIPDAWNTVPIAATLTPNTFYWLVYNSNGTSSFQNNGKFDTGTTGQTVRRSQTFATWPSSYGTPVNTFATRSSMYVTYGAVTAPSDTTVPTVSLTAPANNASVSGTINITATASDNFGVTNVEFYLDDVLNSTDTSSPYSYSLNTTALTNAAHTITAKAYDAAGNATISSAVTVTVNNAVSPPLHQGIVTASATTATSLNVSNGSAGANSLYLASVPIYSNNYREVKSISGGGLTWSRVKRQCSAKIIQPWMELWSATGSPSSSFTATITLSGSPTRWSAIVSRYTGVDMTTPLEGVTGSNTKGMNTVCPNDGTGIDTVAPSLALTASQSNSVLFVATHTRNKTITIPATGFTQRAFMLNTSGGDGANLYVHDRTMATAGRTGISHILTTSIDWDMIGVVVRPAGGTGSPPPPPASDTAAPFISAVGVG